MNGQEIKADAQTCKHGASLDWEAECDQNEANINLDIYFLALNK